jgi:hypothetical protein
MMRAMTAARRTRLLLAKPVGRPCRLWQARKGTSAIETAFILPVLLVGTLGMVEAGRAMWIQSSLQAAVVQAARCAAISPATCPDVPSYASSQVGWLSLPSSDFTYTSAASCGIASYTKGQQVVANYTFHTVVSGLIPKFSTIALSATACHP